MDENTISVNVMAEDYNTDYSMGSGHTFSELSKGTYSIRVMVYDKIGMPSDDTTSITFV